MRFKHWLPVLGLLALLIPAWAQAQGIPMVNVTGGKSGQQYSLTLQLLALMTTLTLLPSMLLMMTSFVRVIIVLSILRQALGTGQTPPNMVLVGLALFFIVRTIRRRRRLARGEPVPQRRPRKQPAGPVASTGQTKSGPPAAPAEQVKPTPSAAPAEQARTSPGEVKGEQD